MDRSDYKFIASHNQAYAAKHGTSPPTSAPKRIGRADGLTEVQAQSPSLASIHTMLADIKARGVELTDVSTTRYSWGTETGPATFVVRFTAPAASIGAIRQAVAGTCDVELARVLVVDGSFDRDPASRQMSGGVVLENADSLATPSIPSKAFEYFDQRDGSPPEDAPPINYGALAELAEGTLGGLSPTGDPHR